MKPTSQKPAKPDAITLLAAVRGAETLLPQPSQTVGGQRRASKSGARAGTRQIAGHFPEATLRALKHLMAEEGTTLQALLDEAIADLLVKKGRSKLAR